MAKDNELRSDIAAAKAKMQVKFGARREIKRLANYLWEGETVVQMTTGTYRRGTVLVVLTDRRLLFVKGGDVSHTSEVSSVQWASGMMMGKITILASGNKIELGTVDTDEGKEFVDKIRHVLSVPGETTPP